MQIRRLPSRVFSLGVLAIFSLLVFAATASANHVKLPPKMGAIGDSLTTAYAADGAKADTVQYSYATGTDVFSHIGRLLAMDPTITAFNFAKTGTPISKLVEQKTDAEGNPIPNQIDLLPRDVEYVTVTVGSTDICKASGPTGSGIFQKRAQSLVSQLRQRLGSANVVILAIPNWYAVWAAHEGDPEMRSRWENACPAVWGADKVHEKNGWLETTTRTYNAHLASACSQIRTPRFKCFYAANVFNLSWSKNQLSPLDGFHPSALGHVKMGKAAWKASPYRLRAFGLEFVRKPALNRRKKLLRLNLHTAPFASLAVQVRDKRGRKVGKKVLQAGDTGNVFGKVRLRGWRGGNVVRIRTVVRINGERIGVKRKFRV